MAGSLIVGGYPSVQSKRSWQPWAEATPAQRPLEGFAKHAARAGAETAHGPGNAGGFRDDVDGGAALHRPHVTRPGSVGPTRG